MSQNYQNCPLTSYIAPLSLYHLLKHWVLPFPTSSFSKPESEKPRRYNGEAFLVVCGVSAAPTQPVVGRSQVVEDGDYGPGAKKA